jgi:ABC-type lipoprotein export system ATPase subunit
MITIQNLAFSFSHSDFRFSLETLQIASGELVAIVGPSGCGKTTFLHLLAGIHVPDQGSVQVLDYDMHALQDHARRAFRVSQIGMVFQNFELISYLTVWDNILLPYRLNTATLAFTPAVTQRAMELADQTGVKHRLQAYPHRLSQGEKQRVAICRALLPTPPLILADEPTGNLDASTSDAIVALLLQQVEQTGATLVLVTHDRSLATRCSRIIDFGELQV